MKADLSSLRNKIWLMHIFTRWIPLVGFSNYTNIFGQEYVFVK